jgi:hypothetical protein
MNPGDGARIHENWVNEQRMQGEPVPFPPGVQFRMGVDVNGDRWGGPLAPEAQPERPPSPPIYEEDIFHEEPRVRIQRCMGPARPLGIPVNAARYFPCRKAYTPTGAREYCGCHLTSRKVCPSCLGKASSDTCEAWKFVMLPDTFSSTGMRPKLSPEIDGPGGSRRDWVPLFGHCASNTGCGMTWQNDVSQLYDQTDRLANNQLEMQIENM